MQQHQVRQVLRSARLIIIAALASMPLAGPSLTAAVEIAPRSVAFRPAGESSQVRAWRPFAFGMDPAEASRAATQAGGRFVAIGATVTGQPTTYHGPVRNSGGKRRSSDVALVWFESGRLSRVTLVLFRLDLGDAEACLAEHRRSVADATANGHARGLALSVQRVQDGLHGAEQSMEEAGDMTWATEVARSPSRVVIETAWEEPASAMQAGTDETCIGAVSYLPAQ